MVLCVISDNNNLLTYHADQNFCMFCLINNLSEIHFSACTWNTISTLFSFLLPQLMSNLVSKWKKWITWEFLSKPYPTLLKMVQYFYLCLCRHSNDLEMSASLNQPINQASLNLQYDNFDLLFIRCILRRHKYKLNFLKFKELSR